MVREPLVLEPLRDDRRSLDRLWGLALPTCRQDLTEQPGTTRGELRRWLYSPAGMGRRAFMVTHHGCDVAGALLRHSAGVSVAAAELFVAPNERRRGIGNWTIGQLWRQAAAGGGEELHVRMADGVSAHGFFHRLGAIVLERHLRFAGSPPLSNLPAPIHDDARAAHWRTGCPENLMPDYLRLKNTIYDGATDGRAAIVISESQVRAGEAAMVTIGQELWTIALQDILSGTMLAFVDLYVWDRIRAYIADTVVDSRHRRKGYGAACVRRALRLATEQIKDRGLIVCWTTADNHAMAALCRSAGLVPRGTETTWRLTGPG